MERSTGHPSSARLQQRGVSGRLHRRGYVLLETVIATGLLIVGLAVLGAQVQDSQTNVHEMDSQITAMMLAEQQLAELEMGLVELDSVDEVAEGDFGPRYPNHGWRLITEPTAIENMFLLQLDVLYLRRDGPYREDDFDYDNSKTLYTVYVMRAAPQPIDFGGDFGLNEEEVADLSERLDTLGIPGLDPRAFDPRFFQTVDFEELIKAAPVLMEALHLDISQLTTILPPDVLQQLQDSGVLDQAGLGGGTLGGQGNQDGRGNRGGTGRP